MAEYHPPSAICRSLAAYDPRMRFGLAYRPEVLGGPSIFIALYIPRHEAGNYAQRSKMYVFADEAVGFAGIYDKNGKLGGMGIREGVPVIFAWPPMHEVMSGTYLNLLRYHSKPQWAVDQQMKRLAIEEGKALKRSIQDASREHGMFYKWAQRTDNNQTRLVSTYEDVKEGLKRPENRKFKHYLDGGDGGYADYFLHKYGLSAIPDGPP